MTNPSIMKTLNTKLLILLVSSVCLFGCRKEDIDNSGPQTPQTPASLTPAPNEIADITKDFAFAVLCISDIDQMMGMSADEQLNHFYMEQPGTSSAGTGTVTIIRDLTNAFISSSFNNARCLDGKLRKGSVFLDYQYQTNSTPNYYREPGFAGAISVANYVVDDWLLQVFDPLVQLPEIKNTTPANFNPTQTNMTWSISGKFKFLHPSDVNRDLILDGTLIKTLMNTADTNVYSPSKKTINWNLAKTRLSGTINGTRGTNNNFTYTIDNAFPLDRNFTCGISPSTFTLSTQFHPFVSGLTNLTLANSNGQISNHNDFLNSTSPACDNSGTVKVNGVTYSVDF